MRSRKDWDFFSKWGKGLSHLDPHTLKCESKVNNSNCGCLPTRIVVLEEYIAIDWNNPHPTHEKTWKIKGGTQGSTIGESVEHITLEQSVEPIAPEVEQISWKWIIESC